MENFLNEKLLIFENLEKFLLEFKTHSDKHIKIEQLRENFSSYHKSL